MWKVSFHDSVATIVPGTLALALLWGRFPLSPVVLTESMPESVQFLIFVVAAFTAGQFCQVVGQLMRPFFWPRGLPTDWTFKKELRSVSRPLTSLVLQVAKKPETEDLSEWRVAVKAARALVTSNRTDSRLDTLYAYCRMFQNLLVGSLALLAFFTGQTSALAFLMLPAIVLSWLGMRTYAHHYGREFFASVHAWHSGLGNEAGDEDQESETDDDSPIDSPLETLPFDESLVAPRRRVVGSPDLFQGLRA